MDRRRLLDLSNPRADGPKTGLRSTDGIDRSRSAKPDWIGTVSINWMTCATPGVVLCPSHVGCVFINVLIRRHSGVELGGRFHTPMLVELGAVPHVLCRTLPAWSALQHHRILHGLQHRLAPNLHAAAEHGRLSHTEHTEPLASQTPRTWMWKAKQKTFWITPSSLCEPSREPPQGSSGQLMVGGRRPGGPQPGGRGRADHRWAG